MVSSYDYTERPPCHYALYELENIVYNNYKLGICYMTSLSA